MRKKTVGDQGTKLSEAVEIEDSFEYDPHEVNMEKILGGHYLPKFLKRFQAY